MHIATKRDDTARHKQEIKRKIPNQYQLPAPLSAARFIVEQHLACCMPPTASTAAGQVEIVRHTKSLDDWKYSRTHTQKYASKQESGKSLLELMCLPAHAPTHA